MNCWVITHDTMTMSKLSDHIIEHDIFLDDNELNRDSGIALVDSESKTTFLNLNDCKIYDRIQEIIDLTEIHTFRLEFNFSIVPSSVEGTSTLDLSLSRVINESSFFMLSPCLTSTSIISTFSKSPISGTNTCLFMESIMSYYTLFL